MHAHTWALGAGWAFAGLSGVLLPALAALRAGAWPALVWCLAGSLCTAATLRRMMVEAKPRTQEAR